MEAGEHICYNCRSLERGQLPGYKGYCPQLKYNFGKTFGQQTYELSKEQHKVQEEQPEMDFSSIWQKRKQLSADLEERRRIVARSLMTDHDIQEMPALYTGDSTRYDKGMIPGYTVANYHTDCTGYIPRWQFKFGKTYKNECGDCLGEFDAMQRIKDCDKLSSLAYPRHLPNLEAVTSETNVREYLNELQNNGCGKALDQVPPIPGYRGFIPHVRTSDVGLGSRFHNMAREGYDALYTQQYEDEEQKGCHSSADDTKTMRPVNDDRCIICGRNVTGIGQ